MDQARDISVGAMARRVREHFTAERYQDWVMQAQPGARVLYGVGENATLAANAAVRTALYGMARQGFVHLFQRRRGPQDAAAGYPFDFIAQRSTKVWPAEQRPAKSPRRQICELVPA